MMRFDMRSPAGSAATTDLYKCAIDMAAWGETRGCVMAGVSEHHTSSDGYLPSPIVLASAIAARTANLQIIVAAALLPFYDPVRLAEDLSVLDHISGGRVSYVFGLGYRPEEYAMFGVDQRSRAKLADEKLEVLLRALRGERFEYDGRTVHVTPEPATPNGPSIAWGGATPAAARRAGRFGVGFFAQTNGEHLRTAYLDACAEAGNEPGACLLVDPTTPLSIFVADDVDRGWEEVGPYLLHDARMYAEWNARPTKYQTASLSYGGTVGELRAENGAHRVFSVPEAIEHTREVMVLPLHPLCGGVPPDLAWPYLERVVDKVLPAL